MNTTNILKQAVGGGLLVILIYTATLAEHQFWFYPVLFIAGFLSFLEIPKD